MQYTQKSNPSRQMLIRDINSKTVQSKSIITLARLHELLQDAIMVEHFTIPPYLSALYSIKEGSNIETSMIIRSVVMEEMLHMVLVANIMNAIGASPKIKGEDIIVGYPKTLPHSAGKFDVGLVKFSKEAVNTFLRIEKPEKDGASPKEDKFDTIGQFYQAIRITLITLNTEAQKNDPDGIFKGNPDKQMTSEHFYGSGGKLVVVKNIDDALEAIEEIMGQGEGINGGITDMPVRFFGEDIELAHYFRFNEIFQERHYTTGDTPQSPPSGEPLAVDWNDVYNMQPNQHMDDFKDNPWLHGKIHDFNRTYMRLLDNIDMACNGYPKVLMAEGIPLMYQLKKQAIELMKTPNGTGNYTAGPTFEYIKDR